MDPIWLSQQNGTLFYTSAQFENQLVAIKPLGWRLFFNTVYCLIGFYALIGNSIVLLVELFGKNSERKARKYLINLSTTSILICVFNLPVVYTDFMYGFWMFPHWLCKFSPFILIVSVFVTSFTLTYIALKILDKTPFSFINTCLKCNTNVMLAIGWVIAIFIAFYSLKLTKIQEFKVYGVSYADCRFNDIMTAQYFVYCCVTNLFKYILPLIIIIVTYIAISFQFYLPVSDSLTSEQRVNKLNKIKIFLPVSVGFFVCWLPIEIIVFMFRWSETTELTSDDIVKCVYGFLILYWLAIANSFLNPCIYYFTCKNFRHDLYGLIRNRRKY